MKPATYDAPGQAARNSLTPLPAMREAPNHPIETHMTIEEVLTLFSYRCQRRHSRPQNLGQ